MSGCLACLPSCDAVSLLNVFLSPFFLFLFASVLLRWLRCCSSVWQPSYFWGIPWVWRGASIRFSPSLYKPSGLDGRQSVRRGHCGRQRRRIRVSHDGVPRVPPGAVLSSEEFSVSPAPAQVRKPGSGRGGLLVLSWEARPCCAWKVRLAIEPRWTSHAVLSCWG